MPVIGTYNGAQIITFPQRPGLKQLNLEMNDTVAVSRSPFTGATQLQAWPGSDFWTGELTLPQMTAATAATWTAFLGECRGMTNVFLLGHPLYRQPLGCVSSTSSPVIAGVNAAMATVLNTRGWAPNVSGLLLPGDRIQIGATPSSAASPGLCRYHVVVERVDSDASGNASFPVWPSLREATSDGGTLVFKNPRGLWRLAENKRSMLSAETRLSGTSMKIVEAR